MRARGTCTDCGKEGELDYQPIPGERYDDPSHGVLVLQTCPACHCSEHTLIPGAYFVELLTRAALEGELEGFDEPER